ncbi:MAG: putative phage tail protein [Lachnospiraceae bacterium]|nr:putative phage tail protein [Lachnospiraceae bacterium]
MAEIESYYPDILKEVREFQALAVGENPEIALVYNAINDVMDEQFISTAKSYGVARLEKIIGITSKATDTLEERRFRLLAKYNEDVPYTVLKLNELLATLCGTDGYILEINNGAFALKVKVALTSKKNKDAVSELLERVTPMNMVLSVELMYNQWYMADGLTWGSASDFTWNEIREEAVSVG